MVFEVKEINWPWQNHEELVLKPDAKEKETAVAEVKILLTGKDAIGKVNIGDKVSVEIKAA